MEGLGAQPEDSFVAADAFFKNPDAGMAAGTGSVTRSKRQTLQEAPKSRRRSQRFAPLDLDAEEAAGDRIPAVLSPATTATVAAKREAARFPAVMDSKTAAASAAAAAPLRSSVNSELYQSASSTLSESGGDLSALQSAVRALKSSTVPGAAAAVPAMAPPPAPAAPAAPATYVPITQVAASRSASIEALQQRVAKISMAAAGGPRAAAAPVAPAPAPAASAPTVPATTPAKTLPKTPQAPANTPASPAARGVRDAPFALAAALEAAPVASPPMPNTEGARTEYDGDDDVVMGDATPVSVAGNTTAPRGGGGGASTGGRSSRFRIEALRQGVTPLRVREHRASLSPSARVAAAVPALPPPPQPLGDDDDTIMINPRAAALLEKYRQGAPEPAAVPAPIVAPVPARVPAPVAPIPRPAAPTMSGNPLAELPAAPAPAAESPAHTASSGSAVSNNPLFAGTPSHPTPGSVNMRRPSLSLTAAAAARSPSTGGSAASEGMRLAEQLHAAAEKLQTPVQSGAVTNVGTPVGSAFRFQGDVQAMLAAMDAGTPQGATPVPLGAATAGPATGTVARALAAASTEERPGPRARRSTLSPSSGGAPLLDLAAFDVNGERTAPGQGTPLLPARASAPSRTSPAAARGTSSPQVAALLQRVSDLEYARQEASLLLVGYQGTIAELQDRHSAELVRLRSEVTLLKGEADRYKSERDEINGKFETLYREKYMPQKNEVAALRRGADALRVQLAEEGDRSRRVTALEAELSACKAALAAEQQAVAAAKAEATAAREAERLAEAHAADAGGAAAEAERRWASKFATEGARAEQALAAKDAELATWRDKHAALAKQHDEAVRRAHVAHAAKERTVAEMARKEEEICALEVTLREFDVVLGQYKAENGKFVGIKESYKQRLAAMDAQLHEVTAEKARLAAMLTDLK